jgi:MraZ protein
MGEYGAEHMFLGEYTHNLDDKGRLTIPSKHRRELATGLVVTRGMDRCLFLFPMAEWEKLAEPINRRSITDRDTRDFRRLMFSGASDIIPDKLGRILIPPYLREYAGLGNEVVIVGLYTHLEIWNPQTWAEVMKGVEEKTLSEHWDDFSLDIPSQ